MKTDGQLLTAYAKRDSQEAFAELVRRHGPMVEATCRRRLGPEAEDAFQAVFVLLARKAAALSGRSELGPWLYRACGFVTRSSIRERKRRRHHEKEAADMKKASASPAAMPSAEQEIVARHVDDAVSALPARFRRVVILCYLEGATQQQAAERLRLPLGTVAWRCSRGLEKLRGKLERRGVTLGAAALGSLLLAEASSAAPSFSLLPSALAAPKIAAAGASAGTAAISAAIAEGAIKMMFWMKMTKISAAIATAVLALGCAGAPIIVSSMRVQRPAKPSVEEVWVVDHPPLTIPEATVANPQTGPDPRGAKADLLVQLRCTAVERIGKTKKYTLDVVEVTKGEAFDGPIQVTAPGRRPGTLDFVSGPMETGSVKLTDRLKGLLAKARPGLEFRLAMNLSESVRFDPPLNVATNTASSGNFGYATTKRGGKFVSIHRFALGEWFRIPDSGARVRLKKKRDDLFAREGIDRLTPAVMRKLRRQEVECLQASLAVDDAYNNYMGAPSPEALGQAASAVARVSPAWASLRRNIEAALREALGPSYSYPVSIGSQVHIKDSRVTARFSVTGVNRPLREYVTALRKSSASTSAATITLDDRIAEQRLTLDTKHHTVEELARLLARKVRARVVRRGSVLRISLGSELPGQKF